MAKGCPIPYDVITNHKSWGNEGERGGLSEQWHLSYAWWALVSWMWLNTCLTMRSSEWIPSFTLFGCVTLALPGKLSISAHKFSHFYLPSFLFHPMGGEDEWAAVSCLAVCLELTNSPRFWRTSSTCQTCYFSSLNSYNRTTFPSPHYPQHIQIISYHCRPCETEESWFHKRAVCHLFKNLSPGGSSIL